MDSKPKNREWVKNAAIIFLAVLLILTFFSRTIMNRTLPEVSTQYVTDGSITAKVRGTGKVTAVGNHVVKADRTREIRAVMVKLGQEVKVGDVLFVLGEGASEEIEAAQETLRQLETSYARSAASISYPNYSGDERRINDAKEAMDTAKANLDRIASGTGSVDEILSKQTSISELLEEAIKVRDAEREAYDTLIKAAQEDLSAKAQLRDDAQRTLTQNGITVLERWKFLDGSGNTVTLDEYGNVIDTVQQNYSTSPQLYTVWVGEDVTTSAKFGAELEDVQEWNENPAMAEEVDPSEEPITEPAEPVYEPVEPVTPVQPEPAAPVVVPVSAGDVSLMQDYQTKQQAVDAAQLYLEDIPRSNLDAAQARVDELQAEYDGFQSAIDAILASSKDSEAYITANAAYKAARENYYSLVEALQTRQEADARTQSLAYIDLTDIAAQIERQKQKVAELSGGEDNQIVAKVAGTIQTISATAGDTKVKDDILCTIEVPDMGYTLSFSVTNEQARRLRVGDSATVSNYYWGNQVVATLSTITADPKSPQTNKILTFDLSGDVNSGADLTVSVGQKSANYDNIIPNSAIRSDTNGTYVFVVEAKNSPLGNRYIARRVEVQVLAEDDSNSAVTGDLGYGSYVITTSNAPIKNGDQVRLADNG